MARKPVDKKLINTRLASGYGGWIYCDNCGENIGYLCYVTYDNLNFEYECNCGKKGSINISFNDILQDEYSNQKLIIVKNRLCCPIDKSPLLSILEDKLIRYKCEIACISCKLKFTVEKK